MVYIFMADGCEEIEALTVVDLMRRAEIPISMVELGHEGKVKGAHGITIIPDMWMENVEIDKADMLVLPGGMPGTVNLENEEFLIHLIQMANDKRIPIGAICAAPRILGDMELLVMKQAACYPGVEERLKGAEVVTDPVVTDGHITTSRGLGTAIPFALRLIAVLKGQEEADRISKSIVYSRE